MACNFFDIDLEVYTVKVSYQQKPYRRITTLAPAASAGVENFGADVYASPTDRTHAGRAALEQDPNNPGSLGLAISEAVEVAATSGGAKKYSLGSVLNHVLMHQTMIGEEALMQTLAPARKYRCGDGRRVSRLCDRLRRRGHAARLCRVCLSLHPPEPDQRQTRQGHRRGAGLVPEHDARQVRLRLG